MTELILVTAGCFLAVSEITSAERKHAGTVSTPRCILKK